MTRAPLDIESTRQRLRQIRIQLIGIAAFAVFWDGQARLLFEEGGAGALISLLLLASALACPGAFA